MNIERKKMKKIEFCQDVWQFQFICKNWLKTRFDFFDTRVVICSKYLDMIFTKESFNVVVDV